MWAWGKNEIGQLGDTTNTPRSTPVTVSNLSNVKTIATDHDAAHSLALLNDGTVRAWGYNFFGQLGNGYFGPNADRNTPSAVIRLSGVRSISGGTNHSLAILENGTARAWGYNKSGELGDGTNYSIRYAPAAVKNLTNIKNIDGGREFTLAVTQ